MALESPLETHEELFPPTAAELLLAKARAVLHDQFGEQAQHLRDTAKRLVNSMRQRVLSRFAMQSVVVATPEDDIPELADSRLIELRELAQYYETTKLAPLAADEAISMEQISSGVSNFRLGIEKKIFYRSVTDALVVAGHVDEAKQAKVHAGKLHGEVVWKEVAAVTGFADLATATSAQMQQREAVAQSLIGANVSDETQAAEITAKAQRAGWHAVDTLLARFRNLSYFADVQVELLDDFLSLQKDSVMPEDLPTDIYAAVYGQIERMVFAHAEQQGRDAQADLLMIQQSLKQYGAFAWRRWAEIARQYRAGTVAVLHKQAEAIEKYKNQNAAE